MDIQLADVTIHVDENLGPEQRAGVESKLRAIDGVVSVHNADRTPHLVVVEYNPQKVQSSALLDAVKSEEVHAELIGL
jgi:hypothetical protein